MSTISSFKSKQNKNGVNRDTDCMKKFLEILKRAHVTEIFNFKKKKNEVIDKRAAWIIWNYKEKKNFVKKNL